MLEQKAKQDGPTLEQAIKLLHGYTHQRVLQHNGTVQTIYRIMKCLEALPASDLRDFILADFERRINELTGDGMGREAQVTKSIVELMSQYFILEASEETTDVNTDKAELQTEEKVIVAPTLSQETPEEAETQLDAAVAGELEGDAKAEIAGDDADEAEIEELEDIDEDEDLM